MTHFDGRGGLLVAVGSALLIATSSLVVTFLTLTVNGSPAMDGNLKTSPVKELEEHGLPKLDTGKLIIDTDAGVDDAVALLLALGYEAKQPNSSSRIIAVTCVFGNTDVNNVVVNVLKVLKTANRLDAALLTIRLQMAQFKEKNKRMNSSVFEATIHSPLICRFPFTVGASRSLLVTPPIEDFYGKDGLGDFVYPDPPNPVDYLQREHAVNALVRLASQYPKQITLLCLGPLTNVALAIRLDPLFITNLKQLVVLGGSTEGFGNVMPGIEFNFYVDPEANFIVFDSVNASDSQMRPIVLFPWESVVKRNTVSMQWRREELGSVSSPSVRLLNLAERQQLSDDTKTEWHSADPLITAVILDPSLVGHASRCYNVMPEVQGMRARGALFVDYTNSLRDDSCNAVIIERIDILRYKKLLLNVLA